MLRSLPPPVCRSLWRVYHKKGPHARGSPSGRSRYAKPGRFRRAGRPRRNARPGTLTRPVHPFGSAPGFACGFAGQAGQAWRCSPTGRLGRVRPRAGFAVVVHGQDARATSRAAQTSASTARTGNIHSLRPGSRDRGSVVDTALPPARIGAIKLPILITVEKRREHICQP